jgi:hypothetical protein
LKADPVIDIEESFSREVRVAMKRAGAARGPNPTQQGERLGGLISKLCLEAMDFVSKSNVEETVRHWLA